MAAQKRNELILTTVTAAMLILGLGAVGWRAAASLAQSGRSIIEMWAEIATLEARRKILGSQSAGLDELEAQTNRLKNFFVDPANPLAFIQTVETLANQTGISANLSLSATPGQGNNTYLVAASGDYLPTMQFLQKLETLPLAARILEIRLERPAGAGETSGGTGTTLKKNAPAGLNLQVILQTR